MVDSSEPDNVDEDNGLDNGSDDDDFRCNDEGEGENEEEEVGDEEDNDERDDDDVEANVVGETVVKFDPVVGEERHLDKSRADD